MIKGCVSDQCRGKLLFKVMHYNVALLPEKVMRYVTFALFFLNLVGACLFGFNITRSIFFRFYFVLL